VDDPRERHSGQANLHTQRRSPQSVVELGDEPVRSRCCLTLRRRGREVEEQAQKMLLPGATAWREIRKCALRFNPKTGEKTAAAVAEILGNRWHDA